MYKEGSMSMPGRSSRSRRRWSISWRSTRCPTASTATGQAVTAATGWRDIGVRLQPVWFNLSFFQGRTILGCWRSKPGGTPGTCSTIARASEAPTTPVALSPSTGLRVLHLLSFSMIVTAGNPEQRLTKWLFRSQIEVCVLLISSPSHCHTSHPANANAVFPQINWTRLSQQFL